MHRAAKTALAPPTGPVFLSLPGDILKNEGDIDLLEPTRVAPRIRGDRDAVEAAAELLAQGRAPGHHGRRRGGAEPRACRARRRLPKLIGAPVYAEFVAEHRLVSVLASAVPRRDDALAAGVREMLDQHDLLFSVGGDLFTLSLPSDVEPMPPGISSSSISTPTRGSSARTIRPRSAILGDPKATLPDITAARARAHDRAARKARARERLEAATDAIKAEREALARQGRAAMAGKTPVQPLALLEAIGAMLPKDAVVIEEALSSAPGVR